MRTFIAIDFPRVIKDYLFNLEKELNKLPMKCKFIAKKNIHITLKFFSDLKKEELILIKEKLRELKYPKFKVSLKNIKFFPSKYKARIIWVGLNNEDKLLKLQQDIDSDLIDVLKLDSQKFQAHITLGRIKFIKNKEEFNKEIDKIKIQKLEFQINSFSIYESKLTKDGPLYKKLEEFELI